MPFTQRTRRSDSGGDWGDAKEIEGDKAHVYSSPEDWVISLAHIQQRHEGDEPGRESIMRDKGGETERQADILSEERKGGRVRSENLGVGPSEASHASARARMHIQTHIHARQDGKGFISLDSLRSPLRPPSHLNRRRALFFLALFRLLLFSSYISILLSSSPPAFLTLRSRISYSTAP